MIRLIRIAFLGMIALLGVSAFIWSQQKTSADVLVVSGLTQVSDALQLDVSISPPISQPGSALQLNANLINFDAQTHAPEVVFRLPAGVSFANQALPIGATMNMQTNSLHWLPVLQANGGSQQFALSLRVETVDIANPNREVTAVIKLNGAEETVSAPFWSGIEPAIESIISPPQVSIGQPFQLRANVDGSGPITQHWDLGDGRVLNVNDPIVVFPAAGSFTVHLEANNPIASDSATKTINVVPHPAAQFTMSDLTPGAGQAINFINQSGGAFPLQYFWDFGDGNVSSEPSPNHQYDTIGTYEVHLRVWNEYGASDAYWPVTVGEPPVADMVVPESVPAGQQMAGTAFGDDSVIRFEWAMGDGRYKEGEQINHNYTQQGDYYITMIAVNEFGGTEVGRWIHVDEGMLHQYLPIIMSSTEMTTTTNANDALLGLNLPPVELDAPFVMQPLDIPAGTPPIEQLYIYINEARHQFNLPPLQNDAALNAIGQGHADDMAAYGFTAHIGSDGSTSAERYIWHQYPGGYAGEATAWGFEHPYQAVEFWVNSPSHRRIILNEAATSVGVGFTANVNAPNVWYWTAEFGNAYAAPEAPVLRLQQPAPNTEAMVTTAVTYGWNWPAKLSGNQKFVVYLLTNQGAFPVAEVTEPQNRTFYGITLAANDLRTGKSRLQVMPGRYQWQVKLEDGSVLVESEPVPITLLLDPDAPTATPKPTETGTAVAPTAVLPTVTPTTEGLPATPLPPSPTPPPPLFTATPVSQSQP